MSLAELRAMIEMGRAHAVQPTEYGDYLLPLPDANMQAAFDAGLAPLCLVPGSPWRNAMLP